MGILKKVTSHSVFRNTSALGLMQIANYIVPLLLIPFLTRKLGVETYGAVAITLAVSQFAFVITDYGFSLSATYGISKNRENKSYINSKITSIFYFKFILILISLLLVNSIPYILPGYIEYKKLFSIVSIAVVAQAFQPIWLFQGLEKMKNITIYSILTKAFYAALVILYVKNDSDAEKIIFFWGLSQASGTFLALYFMYKSGYRLVQPSFKIIVNEVKESAEFFWSRLAVSIYTSISLVVVGLAGPAQAALYSVCEQIYKAGQSVTSPLSNAMFPYMAKNKDWNLFYKVFISCFLFLILGSVVVALYAEELLSLFFGDSYEGADKILLIFVIAISVNYIAVSFGYSAFSAISRIDIANKSVVYGMVFHLFFLCIAFYFGVSAFVIAVCVLLTELIVAVTRLLFFFILNDECF